MKIGLMSGAAKNAGDFLIVERTEALLKKVYPDADITRIPRWKNVYDRMPEINAMDAVVFAGGPLFDGLANNTIRAAEVANFLKCGVVILGGGGGNTVMDGQEPDWNFRGAAADLLAAAQNNGRRIGCRDFATVCSLRRAGIGRVAMTGCPALFDMDYLGITEPVNAGCAAIPKSICISDPGRAVNLPKMVNLAAHLKTRFPQAQIFAAFHRGWTEDEFTPHSLAAKQQKAVRALEAVGAKCLDLSYSTNGMEIYDRCDIHVGFRLHAHVCCLSHRRVSLLIEEDGRGAGMNGMLGIAGVRAYSPITAMVKNKRLRKAAYCALPQRRLLCQVDDTLDMLAATGYRQYRTAFQIIDGYYEDMIGFLKSSL